MQTERVVPLALPRGRNVFCELCRAPATVRCGGCGVTFYWCVRRRVANLPESRLTGLVELFSPWRSRPTSAVPVGPSIRPSTRVLL